MVQSYGSTFSTNIVNMLLLLLDRHFPKSHRPYKILNRNNVKIRYGFMSNFVYKKIINNKILKPSISRVMQLHSEDSITINGDCLQSGLFYIHCTKCRNFTYFSGEENLWKATISLSSRRIAQKVCGNYVFQQKFHTRELSEIAVFYAVTCKVNTPHITGNEPHCISLTGNTFKDSKNSFEYGRKCNATELSNFIWENNPKNISTMLELDILEKSKAYKPG